ncbi:histidine decarboxylase-like [Entelurus aequoreus]|uniref:histidine decarboxylase-like n=1 Tax=Entelurus aequoreus TaxID=161455 RepID=UPI002B1E603C|nr:histidine decarboxylase-like [Entelurus aequoreus]
MQAEEYNLRGKELVDYITKYLSTIQDRRVIPDVKPGYMTALIPERAPAESEDWDAIFEDFQRVVMPGVVHWQSPHMHAYYPSLTSWPSLLGDMLADAINCVGFTWPINIELARVFANSVEEPAHLGQNQCCASRAEVS